MERKSAGHGAAVTGSMLAADLRGVRLRRGLSRRATIGGAAATEPPTHFAALHAEPLLFIGDRRRILEANDLVEQRAPVAVRLLVDRPAFPIIDAGVAKATPVGIVGDYRAPPDGDAGL
jgi:hypothetical protein